MIVPPGQQASEGGRRTRVKFCGLTQPGDAEFAASLGVDAVGVVFAESPRRLDIPAALEVLTALPETTERVGVFADQPVAFVREAARLCGLDWIQLSGSEPGGVASAVATPATPVIKAVHVTSRADLVAAAVYPATGFLLDAPVVDGRRGGTGTAFDWAEVHVLPWPRWRVIVAGGLTPENVANAIIRLRPGGVDVSSGIEMAPGIKDRAMMEDFMEAVRATDARLNAVSRSGGTGGSAGAGEIGRTGETDGTGSIKGTGGIEGNDIGSVGADHE
jgi:phosphoribosylanthranilate isomerase